MAWLGLLWAGLLGGQAAAEVGPSRHEIELEALNPGGEVVTDQLAGRVEALVDGQTVAISDLGEASGEWRVVLLFDQVLTSPLDFGNAALQLAERSRELTRLGPVEILLAGREMRTGLPATRDADVLEQALHWIRLREESDNLQEKLRWSLLEDTGLVGDGEISSGVARSEAADVEARVRMAVRDEAELLREYHEQLLLWVSEETTPGPKAIFMVASGYDADPDEFYRSLLVREYGEPTAARLAPQPSRPSALEVAQTFSAYGWVVLPYVPEQRANELLEPDEDAPLEQEGKDKVDVIIQDGRIVDKTTIGVDPLKWLRERREEAQKQEGGPPLVLDPAVPLQALAEATGGELIRGKFQLSDLIERLPRRQRLDLGEIEASGRQLLEVRLIAPGDDSGSILRYRRWLSDITPEVVSQTRAARILQNDLDDGELPLVAALQPSEDGQSARLVVKRDVYDVENGARSSPLRVTVAVPREGEQPEIFHEEHLGWGLVGEGEDPVESVLEVELGRQPEGPVVVLVEELDRGVWGATFASFVEPGATVSMTDSLESLVLPAPQVIHLMAPRQGFAMGRTLMETVVSRREVASVEFLMDGESKVVRDSPPFSASLDLGPLPQPRRVTVVARDSAGVELGRDFLIVNEGSGVFGVRIVKPRPGEEGQPQRFAGPIDVHAEVEPRRGQGIDRVEFYWKEALAATRYAPPYRQRIVIPPEAPRGFIRVVAYLEDGNSSEDVVFLNSPGSSERLQVNLMELYVVVTDRKGRPVTDLPRERFRVLEDGVAQEIGTFNDAGDLPLTVGLAIDSSASMFVKLPEVQFAAAEFLRGLATRRDRAFVVGFGTEPRLTRNTTSDLPEVIKSLDLLQPDGQTGIWKAVVYSLVQLQGVPGKKALVVYTDGADEDPDFAYRTALRFARKVGVPIYVILSNNEINRTQGKGLSVRGFLERLETLATSVGGKVFFARVGQDLQDVYAEIDEELRNQYLVGYYSEYTGGEEWRQIEVGVEGGGLSARTIAGYYR
ncbi:MAG: VWA domain-containing protein [Thermoanaerobaculia bacterium]